MNWTCLALKAAFIWLGILLLLWRPRDTREFFDAVTPTTQEDLSDITLLITARNEAKGIEKTFSSVKTQGLFLNIVLVDNQSTDWTVDKAPTMNNPNLRIITGEPLPLGWRGKLWALEQGMHHAKTPITLLFDADIELQPGIFSVLRKKMKEDGLQLISLMPVITLLSFWKRLLMPAFP